ncbi:MAG: hypothetical protein IPI08_13655 [Betaproteobacteria bacterium]|nr:hypothetical protein [Betaproteobacteria bacterium]
MIENQICGIALDAIARADLDACARSRAQQAEQVQQDAVLAVLRAGTKLDITKSGRRQTLVSGDRHVWGQLKLRCQLGRWRSTLGASLSSCRSLWSKAALQAQAQCRIQSAIILHVYGCMTGTGKVASSARRWVVQAVSIDFSFSR